MLNASPTTTDRCRCSWLAATCAAVKSTVPQSMWSEIIEKLDEAEQDQEVLDVGEGAFDDDDDEPFDPTEFIDDEF